MRIAPRILYLDIETAMMKVYLYDLYGERNRYINADMLSTQRFVVNWAAAWIDPHAYTITKMFSGVVTNKEAVRQNDKRILQPLFSLMDRADYICGHNSKGFDVKILKWRFLYHGWGYPNEAKQVDTLTQARETRPESRGLNFMMKQLGHKGKRYELTQVEWQEVIEKGTPALLNKANRYCRNDVKIGVDLLRILTQAKEQSGKVVFK